jgi:steroid delta-isomerase-like uncharacterized protein
MLAQNTAIEERPRNASNAWPSVTKPIGSRLVGQAGRDWAMGIRSFGSSGARDPRRILQRVMAALNEGKFTEALEQFGNRFKFTDHALGLEFVEKNRLIEFFQKTRQLFPDTVLVANAISECKDNIVVEWRLRATQTESFLGGLTRRARISLRGVSIVKIENERISQWSDYYDQLTPYRGGLAANF